MTFLFPWGLLVLIPVAALAIAYLVMLRRRDRYAVRFAALPLLDKAIPERPRWRRHLPAGLLLAALGLTAVAVARPEMPVRVPYERATILVAIDTSDSMRATDVDPDRLTAALDAAGDFIGQLPDTFNVGVVTFSGSATVIHPADGDHDAARRSLRMVTTQSRTAIGDGVLASLEQIRAAVGPGQQELPAHIVLLSDGSNTSGTAIPAAAEQASDAGVPVSTIAYGSEWGTLLSGGYAIPVPVDHEALAELSDTTGGTAYEAENRDELRNVYRDIGSSIGWRTEQREVTPWVAGIALLFGLVAAAFSLRWFSRLL
ncbi:VWA domain-containing protein [Gordonia sp. CPCC 205515]|uniref:VWA domain-containing protein n=1 Tax=Gordonia sp. CPCC 205515 TaxID=3140791 RepID=UPI003AF3FDD4